MKLITLENNGVRFWLRGTTWAFRPDRASQYSTIGEAQLALKAALPFMKPALRKLARIVNVDPMHQALATLVTAIMAGAEYPDASARAATHWGVAIDALTAAYDAAYAFVR